jgi:hypothetical protein
MQVEPKRGFGPIFTKRKKKFILHPESLVFLPKLQNRVNHIPQFLKPFILPPYPGYRWFSKAVSSFSFLFISNVFLKNHSKSQKNNKIENIIFLDST